MLTITNFLKNNWQFIAIVLMGIYISYMHNTTTIPGSVNDDRIDSILRVVSIPRIEGTFILPAPEPIYIKVPQKGSTNTGMSDEMLKAFQELKDDNAKTRAYAKVIALKYYEKIYQDSVVTITVKDSIEGGNLVYQEVDWVFKEHKVKFYENIYYMKPKFTLSVGAQLQSGGDEIGSNPQLFFTLGVTNKKGWKYTGGINVLEKNEYMIGLEKNVFTKYNKIVEKRQF